MRKQLHQLLGLPMDRPMLRIANALTFGTAGQAISGYIWLYLALSQQASCNAPPCLGRYLHSHNLPLAERHCSAR